MKRLLIVGAGGFGREMFNWVRQHPDHGRLWAIGGFLDDNKDALAGYSYTPGVVGSVKDYQPAKDDILVLGLALPNVKKVVVGPLLAAGAQFLTFVHPTAVLGANVSIGKGGIVCPNAVITSDIQIGNFVTINCLATVGHDARLGDYVTLSAHCDVTGFCRVDEGALFGTHACMIPRTKAGAWSVVGAGSTVIMNVPPSVTVIGSPAKRLIS